MKIRFILGLMFGLMLGGSVALALAPQPGSVTRQRLWEQVRERARRREQQRIP